MDVSEWITEVLSIVFIGALVILGIDMSGVYARMNTLQNVAQFAIQGTTEAGEYNSSLAQDIQAFGAQRGLTFQVMASNVSSPASFGAPMWVTVTTPYRVTIPLLNKVWSPTLSSTMWGISQYKA